MKVKIIFMASSLTLLVDNAVAESDLRFNPAFINGEADNNVDLSWIGSGNEISQCHYNVNIYINDNFAFTADIPFVMKEDVISPQFSKEQLDTPGIDLKQLAGAHELQQQQAGPWSLEDVLPQATFAFISKNMTLRVSVPQRYMLNLPRGYINPESWDYGLTSGWINYGVNGSRDDSNSGAQSSSSSGFRAP